VIGIERLTFAYPAGRQAGAGMVASTLRDITLNVAPGEMLLVVGASGSGKSTLLRCLNGLIPHFHGGDFSGRVLVGGRDTRERPPRDLADVVGLVLQDPESQMVAETVEDEIAFGLENLGRPPPAIRKRLEEALDQLHIAPLRARRLDTLSGGELQRVAIAAVLAMQPRVLLLDEPTSQLDPQSAEELLTAVKRLNDDLGLTVIIAEHRLERVVQYADRVLYLPGDGSARALDVREAMKTLPLAPPVVRLGRSLGWSPLPLSVKEGRRFAEPLPERVQPAANGRGGEPSLRVTDLTVRYESFPALRGVSFEAWPREVIGLMGRNGAGKTTLLRALVGLAEPYSGSVSIAGHQAVKTEALAGQVALVPQEPATALYHRTVSEEIADTLAGAHRAGSVDQALAEWRLDDARDANPLDLSAGQRQRTALAAILVGAPSIILLDEPTRGMDYQTKELLVENLKRRAAAGATVIVASHDVELVARCADRVLLLAEGEAVLDGPVREALTETLTFSTQVNKLFGGSYLTPEDVLTVAQTGARPGVGSSE
jgi:energy-coupling factor transporter ATP-binding protein EcfA2